MAASLAGVLTGCASDDAQPRTASGLGNAPTAELVAFGEDLFGTQDQRRAGELVSYHSFNDAIAACMQARGATHQAVPFVDITRGWDVEAAVSPISSWLTPPGSLGGVSKTTDMQQRAANAEAAVPIGDDAYVAASAACSTSGLEEQRDNVPAEAMELLEALNPVLETLVPPEAQRAYLECMADAGYDGLEEPGDLTTVLLSRTTDDDGRPVGRPQAEADGNAADLRCRGSDYAEMAATAATELNRFSAEHADEMEAVQAAWDDLVAEASTYPEWNP